MNFKNDTVGYGTYKALRAKYSAQKVWYNEGTYDPVRKTISMNYWEELENEVKMLNSKAKPSATYEELARRVEQQAIEIKDLKDNNARIEETAAHAIREKDAEIKRLRNMIMNGTAATEEQKQKVAEEEYEF